MARGALNWTVKDLAREAGLASNTVIAFEHGRSMREISVARIRTVLESRGIRFIDDTDNIGVSLEKA